MAAHGRLPLPKRRRASTRVGHPVLTMAAALLPVVRIQIRWSVMLTTDINAVATVAAIAAIVASVANLPSGLQPTDESRCGDERAGHRPLHGWEPSRKGLRVLPDAQSAFASAFVPDTKATMRVAPPTNGREHAVGA